MGEFASSGVGTAGLTTGVIGTTLGALNSGIFGGDGIGGLFGGGGRTSSLWAENAKLRAERYADNVGIETYKQSAKDNRDLRDRIMGEWLKPIAQEAAANRERLAALEAKVDGNKALQDKENELLRKEIEIANLKLNTKVDMVAMTAKNGIDQLSNAVGAINATISAWKCNKINKDSICPPVMERYNQFEVPTNAAPAVQPITGTVNAI